MKKTKAKSGIKVHAGLKAGGFCPNGMWCNHNRGALKVKGRLG